MGLGLGKRVKKEMEEVGSKLHLFGCQQKDLEKISKSEYEKSEKFRKNWRNSKKCLQLFVQVPCHLPLAQNRKKSEKIRKKSEKWRNSTECL